MEGIPSKAHTLHSNIPKLEYVANSGFTKTCLERAGYNVIDVCHHAINWDKCRKLKEDSKTLRKKWTKEFRGRAKIIFVGRNDPRKGLDHLEKAINIVNRELKSKVIFLIFSEGKLDDLEKHTNVLRIGNVGALPHDQVLRMIGASDYLVFPSVCEGFGLPLLEANAMGIPAIHCWMPPLSEFSSKDFNFTFGFQRESLVNQANLQYWHFHEYRPEMLAEMMMEAINTYVDRKGEYKEFCKLALAHSKKWDYHTIYSKLLDRLEV
ncbi:hypothetical protein ES705_50172 [subsurface metagenome]